jgi:hypothetical protein
VSLCHQDLFCPSAGTGRYRRMPVCRPGLACRPSSNTNFIHKIVIMSDSLFHFFLPLFLRGHIIVRREINRYLWTWASLQQVRSYVRTEQTLLLISRQINRAFFFPHFRIVKDKHLHFERMLQWFLGQQPTWLFEGVSVSEYILFGLPQKSSKEW